jgi:hypothetical protein
MKLTRIPRSSKRRSKFGMTRGYNIENSNKATKYYC